MMNSLFDYLVETEKKYGNKTAVVCGESSISFSELLKSGCAISQELINRNVNKKPIYIYLPKNEKIVISIVGVLGSGNFYTPTDVKFPIEKPKKIYQGLKPAVTITDSEYYSKCIEMGIPCADIINIDEIIIDANMTCINNNSVSSTTEDLAYVLFTSGSTGNPQGVTITRGAVIDYINWVADTFEITEKDSICNQAPFYFDNSTLDVYLMITRGATLHIVPESYYAFPAQLGKYLVDNSISTIFWVPSVFQIFQRFDLLSKFQGIKLRKILFAGEVMHNKELNYWRKKLPNALYANLYGPTEITVDCTYYIVDRDFDDDEPLPIGKSRRNMDVFLLDENNKKITEPEMQGEICVRGYAISKGYWDNKERTEKAFVQNPLNNQYDEKIYRTGDIGHFNLNNEIMFDGRLDNQIKHKGCRIELGEIENMSLVINEIQQVCVVYDSNSDTINMFVVIEKKMTEKEIAQKLKGILPNYMMPEKINIIDKMPVNDNGKYDRKKLKTTLWGNKNV